MSYEDYHKKIKEQADREAARGESEAKAAGESPEPVGALLELPDEDPGELIQHRFLCRGGGGIIVGQTGVGKSSFTMNAAFRWAAGMPFMDIKPSRPLKILMVQAENDKFDMAEHLVGVVKSMELEGASAEAIARGMANMLHIQKTDETGPLFTAWLDTLLAKFPVDLVICDPALAYVGADNDKSAGVTPFLRNCLNRVIIKRDVGILLVHHTTKPPKERTKGRPNDYAYMMSGSADWANWARCVLYLENTFVPGVFRLIAAKRARLGWKDQEGNFTSEKWITHFREKPDDRRSAYWWKECTANEAESAAFDDASATLSRGRPRKIEADDLAKIMVQEISEVKPLGEFRAEFMKKHDVGRDKVKEAEKIAILKGLSKQKRRRPDEWGGGFAEFIGPVTLMQNFDPSYFFISSAMKDDDESGDAA